MDAKYYFNRIRTSSRILADHNDEQFIVFTAFKFNPQGVAKQLATWSVKYEKIKYNIAYNIPMKGKEETFLDLKDCSVRPKISFLDYIFGGTEI